MCTKLITQCWLYFKKKKNPYDFLRQNLSFNMSKKHYLFQRPFDLFSSFYLFYNYDSNFLLCHAENICHNPHYGLQMPWYLGDLLHNISYVYILIHKYLLCVIISSFLFSVEKILQIIYVHKCKYYLYLCIFCFIDF